MVSRTVRETLVTREATGAGTTPRATMASTASSAASRSSLVGAWASTGRSGSRRRPVRRARRSLNAMSSIFPRTRVSGQRRMRRRDRCGGSAVDALAQLDVVLDDDVDGQVVLDRHGQLGQQVLMLLAYVELHVVAQSLGLLGVDCLDVGDGGGQSRVQAFGDVD